MAAFDKRPPQGHRGGVGVTCMRQFPDTVKDWTKEDRLEAFTFALTGCTPVQESTHTAPCWSNRERSEMDRGTVSYNERHSLTMR